MSSTYRTLNLRADSQKEQHSLSIRVSARQKNKSSMWERLTFNFLKKFYARIPDSQNIPATKARVQSIIGEEVSRFLETNNLTDKSLRLLEASITRLLSQEGLVTGDSGNDINLTSPLSPRKQVDLSLDSNTILPDIKASSTINRRKDTLKSDPFSPTNGDPKYDSKTFRNNHGASITNIKEKQLFAGEDRSRTKPIVYTAVSAPQFQPPPQSNTPLEEQSPLKKLPKPEVAELIDGASLLSENEWVEIARY